MGSKLGSFLRVLGAGLSPQAFAAQTNEFSAEQASKRSREANIETIGLKQGMATASILGKAYDAETDPARKKEIVEEVKGIAERATNGDKKSMGAFKSAWLSGRFEDVKAKKEVNLHTLVPPGGGTPKSFRKDDPRVDKLMNEGWTPAPTETLQGQLTTTQKGKLILKGVEGKASLAKNVTEIDNLKKTLADPNFIGGVAGSVIQGLDSSVSQVQQLFSAGPKFLNDDGTVNEKAMDLSPETISRLEKSAGQAGLAKSQTLQLAYIIARANDPSGRLSDRDVKTAEDMLGDTASPRAKGRILDDVKRRLISNYNIEQATIAKSQGKSYERITMKEIKGLAGTKEKTEADTPASRILKGSGLF